jgi:hypothetical protein
LHNHSRSDAKVRTMSEFYQIEASWQEGVVNVRSD